MQFKVRSSPLLIWGATSLLLFVALVFIPFMIATNGQTYPDLDTLLIFYSGTWLIWILMVRDLGRQTTSVWLHDYTFTIKKLWQPPKQFGYDTITGWNERPNPDRGKPSMALTFYLKNDVFVIKSNEFADYGILKARLSQYAEPVLYQKVMTLRERNRLRWLIGGQALLISANIAFGYLAHTSADKEPAPLAAVTDVVDRVTEDRYKGRLKGIDIRLRTYPGHAFYVGRKSYDVSLENVQSAIRPRQSITLSIRESDYRRKIAQTKPLTFGDKFSDYKRIFVFGIRQGNSVRLQTTKPVYEPTHTSPFLRTFFSCILLLICWAGWVYADQHKVLRGD
ncbi:hypothetical protein ACFSUS_02915 [Spirosoma soli]|uniref:DUF3592 domain-containing protein n=2 Tax=Spirosoma soli TaxID=1770529 RepID=A0ABW5LXQ7_9BACT